MLKIYKNKKNILKKILKTEETSKKNPKPVKTQNFTSALKQLKQS